MSRLLIGLITCTMMLAVLASIGGKSVPSAKADRATPVPACGKNNSNFGVAANWAGYQGGNNWQVSWGEYCGSGATVTVEMQTSTDNGQHWSDMGGATDSVFTQINGGQTENRVHTYTSGASGCIIGGGHQYRMHVWANANATTGGPYYHADDITPVICP